MAERFYLRDTQANQSGTLPTSEQSTALPNGTAHNPTFARRDLGRSIGAATVEVVHTHASDTLHHDGLMRMFVSEPLPAVTIAANTWTLAVQGNESSTSADTYTNYVLYVWRPGTGAKVGTGIFDAHSGAQITNGNAELAGTGRVITFAGTAQAVQAGDVLILEVWHHWLQTMASAYTSTLSYGGSVAVTAGGTGTGSYLETPQTLFSQVFTETGRQVTATATVEARDLGYPPVGHDDWFLHRADNGAREVYCNYSNLFWAHIGRTSFQTQARKHLAQIHADGFDGVMLDDVNAQPGHCWSNGLFSDIATETDYITHMLAFMTALAPAVRAAGLQCVVNPGLDPWNAAPYAAYTNLLSNNLIDVVLREFLTNWGAGASTEYFTGATWTDQMKFQQDAEGTTFGSSIPFAGNSYPLQTPDDTRSVRYGLASFYMFWNGVADSAYGYDSADQLTPYPQYRQNIGTPTETKQLVSGTSTDGAWMRHYTNGVAIINAKSTAGLVTFTLGGTYLDPSGASVTSVQLDSGYGMILTTGGATTDYNRLVGFFHGFGDVDLLVDTSPVNKYRYVLMQWNIGPAAVAAIKAVHPAVKVWAYQNFGAMTIGSHENDRPTSLVSYEDALRLAAQEHTEAGRLVTAAATIAGTDGRWGPPLNLQTTVISTSQIDLAWDAVSGATGYDIERDGVVIVSDHATTTYNDTGLSGSTLYNYRVRAVR